MSKIGIFTELMQFLKHNKRWWLIPLVTMMFFLGVIIVLTQSSTISPFIYALF